MRHVLNDHFRMAIDLLWPFPDFRKPHRLWNIGSAVVIPCVGILSKIAANWLNKLSVHNLDVLSNAVELRPAGCPLITVSNHHSCIDEPVIWGTLRLKNFFHRDNIRWSLAAHDICFTKAIHAVFFGLGRTVPIVRGNGVYQKAMDFCIDQLNKGQWVHIFPEGKVNMTKDYMRFKWGIGRLISESNICPLVIPMWHIGMDEVLPNEPPYIPKFGKRVTLVVGEPVKLADVVNDLKVQGKSDVEQRKHITDLIQGAMYDLKIQAEEIHRRLQKP